MRRKGCCSKEGLNRGAWTAHEDKILSDYIRIHGEGKWRNLPKIAGLKRCGKSCRLRWLNYLRPDIKRGNISSDEEDLIIRLHNLLGNRWSLIAGRLPGRTDNEIKNYWNTNLGKKLKQQQQQQTNKHSVPVPPNPITNSQVVRTKATKLSKVLFIPQSSSMHLQNKSEAKSKSEIEAKPLLMKYSDNSMGNQMEQLGNNGNEFLSSFLDEGKEVSTEEDLLNIDFNVGDVCISELLNSDFSNMCNFSYINNDNDPSSNHHPIFSADILKDCNFTDDDNSNNNFHSFLESNDDILGDQ